MADSLGRDRGNDGNGRQATLNMAKEQTVAPPSPEFPGPLGLLHQPGWVYHLGEISCGVMTGHPLQ
jgi:hypothetical protein